MPKAEKLIVSSKLGFWRIAARAAVLSTAFGREYPGLLALAYGHCGKKFAEKLAGEVTHSPASGADTETFV
jgi:hypothetical protein